MPADMDCPATPPELPRDPTPERVKLSPGGGSPASAGRASPDSACPICLGRLDNRAYTDGCRHKFCFTCIVEWSKVRAVCPLCKQDFSSIIHNVRSELDYDRYRLPPPPSVESQHPFIYRPGIGDESRPRWHQLRRQQYRYRSLVLPMLWSVPDGHDYRLPAVPGRARGHARSRVTSHSRRALYSTDMWARPTADELTGRYRETGPEFYRNNPACTHRLVPWLNRELNAVLESPAHLAHVMEHIMELITRLHILSPQFRDHLRPYLAGWTDHFVHELYSYARSPYDMVGYDLNVQYEPGRPDSPPAQEAAPSSEADSDSDVRVLSPEPVVWAPPPGPSGVAAAAAAAAAVFEAADMLSTVRGPPYFDSDSESSDSAVVVVGVVPPRHERPPVVVTLSSDPDEPAAAAAAADPEPPRPQPSRPRSGSKTSKSSKSSRSSRSSRRGHGDAGRSGAGSSRRRDRERRSESRPSRGRSRDEPAAEETARAASGPRRHRHRSRRAASGDRGGERASKTSRSEMTKEERKSRRHRRSKDSRHSRRHKRSRLASDASESAGPASTSPDREAPSTSGGRPRRYRRIQPPASSSSERPSSSSTVTGRPARAPRIQRLVSESSSDDGRSEGSRRPAMRSAVVRARPARSGSEDWPPSDASS